MTTTLEGSYQQFNTSLENEESTEDDTPHDADLIIHVVPESGKSRWNHIEDLDSFFTRMYHYHQKHGFTCMMLQEVLELTQFIFVTFFSILLFHGINYSMLFEVHKNKTSVSDAILPFEQCIADMGFITWSSICVASIFWIFRVVKVLCHFIQFRDIQSFFNSALNINDSDLDNLTWHDVQRKIIEVQKEQEMCIHKRELTELDIYHRILRFTNYIVAMINKSLLPINFQVPFNGEIIFMTQGLKYNLELLLFWGPWSPFENNWHLREDYKKFSKRHELARSLSNYILWVGIVNILLSPVIFLWQILYSFFNYGELLKREPGTLGTRTWSLYGKLYLRHFNELDHELNARLNRAYRPASKYMSLFTSPLITIVSKTVAFISGSMFFVLVILTCYDEDFLSVEHVLMAMTVTGTIATISRSLIPDENLVWCPESLLTAVLAHTHYRPDKWRNQAHTQATRAQVAQLFQYRAIHLFEELLSPLVTPYILCFRLRYRALDIVDFYRNFTIEVMGVGDVCSFAQMDVKKHGNLMWHSLSTTVNQNLCDEQNSNTELKNKENASLQLSHAEGGKTELSLLHFILTNPGWKPPSHGENFVTAIRERAQKELTNLGPSEINPLHASLNSLSSLGPQYSGIVSYIRRGNTIRPKCELNTFDSTCDPQKGETSLNPSKNPQTLPIYCSTINDNKSEPLLKVIRRNVNKAEGPLLIGERSLLYCLQQVTGGHYQSFSASAFGSGFQDVTSEPLTALELTTFDMSLSTLYLYELHYRQVKQQETWKQEGNSIWQYSVLQEIETLPEFGQERTPLLLHQDSSLRFEKNV